MSLSLKAFEQIIEDSSIQIIDARPASMWVEGHIPNSLHVTPTTAKYAVAMGLIDKDTPLLFVLPEGLETSIISYFEQTGFKNIKGYLQGGYPTWEKAQNKFDLVVEIEVDELAMDIPFDEYLMVLDVREETAFDKGHIKNSVGLPLFELMDPGSMSELDEHFNIYIISENGETSSMAASVLKRQGIHNIRIVVGGWVAIQELKEKFTIEKSPEKPKLKKNEEGFNFLSEN